MTPPLSPANSSIAVDPIVVDQHPDTQRPLRLLEDEHVHLQKSGLNLSDFDVRDTLGQSYVLR